MLCLTSMTTNSGCDADPLVSDNEARDLIQRDAKTMHLAFRGLLTSRHYLHSDMDGGNLRGTKYKSRRNGNSRSAYILVAYVWGDVFGLFLMGPAVATMRFFNTLNRIEIKLNEEMY